MRFDEKGSRSRGRGRRQPAHDSEDHEESEQAPTDGADAESPESPEEQEQRARNAVYRLLTARARSRSELHHALLRKGIDEQVATATLDKFADAGLVDDAGFAQSWVRQRHEHQGLGRRALAAELRRKGVDDEAVAEALAEVDEDAEVDRARELVRRKLRTMTATDSTTRTRRLVSMLARKGYSEGMAFRVVREEAETDEDESAPDTP